MKQFVLIIGLSITLAGWSAGLALAQATEVTEYELTKKKSVTFTNPAAGNWVVTSAGAAITCTGITGAASPLTLTAANCAPFFALGADAFKGDKVKVQKGGGTPVPLVLVIPKIEVGVDALGEGSVTLAGYDAGTWKLVKEMTELCTITVPANKTLTITRDACAKFFALTEKSFEDNVIASMVGAAPANMKTLTLGKVGKAAESATPTWDKLDKLSASSAFYYFDGDAKIWVRQGLDDLKKAREKLQQRAFRLYEKSAGGTLVWWTMEIASGGGPPAAKDYTAECRAIEKQNPGANLLCFQHVGGWQLLHGPTRGAIMRPNTPVLAIAFVAAGTGVTFALDGEGGLVVPKFDETVAGRATAAEGGAAPAPLVAARQLFAPRKPGVHPLTVSLESKPTDKVVTELTVETAYAGAIRIGVGAIFGGGRDRSYTALTLPGSGQAEITTSEGGAMDTEIVIGAAAFLDPGGRTYVASSPTRWAPYFGIGILNQTATGFELLKSVHLGAEYEVSRQFSIALTLVGRRVTRLADGLEVGDPIDASTVPTRSGYELGVGVVVNVSPEFLKLAKSPSSGFFK